MFGRNVNPNDPDFLGDLTTINDKNVLMPQKPKRDSATFRFIVAESLGQGSRWLAATGAPKSVAPGDSEATACVSRRRNNLRELLSRW
jgi:hypothetical protein